MKLFIKDHYSFVLLYAGTFIGLSFIIEQLDGLQHHYLYFCFLATLLLFLHLSIRYACRKKMYDHLEKKHLNKESLQIYQPVSSIEKAYAEQLKMITSHLLKMEEEHQTFLKEQQLLISTAAHQMKIPISVIQLLTQNHIQLNTLNDWSKVKAACDRITFSLNQLLTYSRSTQLLSDIKIEPLPLKKVVQEVINDLKEFFVEQAIYPEVHIPDFIILYSDKKWIKVVFHQLLSNAIKYSDPENKVSIDYDKGALLIENHGETIPQSEMPYIFQLFYTGSIGRKKSESTGIGLYLVKKILTTLDHPFDLISQNHKTIFTIHFYKSIANKENLTKG